MEYITAIIESPKNTGHKYNFEPDTKCFKLMKILPAGLVFPYDFGFIPGTRGEDGDPLDIIVISEIKTFPGCCMDCLIIGAIKAEQTEENGQTVRNDRFLGIPKVSQQFSEIKSIKDLPEGTISQIQSFFENYNEQAGKRFNVLETLDAKDAVKLLN